MDRQWSPNLVLAWALWCIGLAIIGADLFISEDDIGHVGLAFFIAGAVFNNRELCATLKKREKAAFEMGEEAGSVRRLR